MSTSDILPRLTSRILCPCSTQELLVMLGKLVNLHWWIREVHSVFSEQCRWYLTSWTGYSPRDSCWEMLGLELEGAPVVDWSGESCTRVLYSLNHPPPLIPSLVPRHDLPSWKLGIAFGRSSSRVMPTLFQHGVERSRWLLSVRNFQGDNTLASVVLIWISFLSEKINCL